MEDKKEFSFESLPKRFTDKVNRTDGCWLWTASKNVIGYGKFTYKDKTVAAHRFSWIHFNGEIPNGLFVLHKCDVRKCVNPNHLFLGTAKDNSQDMFSKKRNVISSGENHGNSKLTEQKVREIRKLAVESNRWSKTGLTYKKIAEMYGIKPQTVTNVIRRHTWKNIRDFI